MEDAFYAVLRYSDWGTLLGLTKGESVSPQQFLIFSAKIPRHFSSAITLRRSEGFELYFVSEAGAVVRRELQGISPQGIPVIFQEYV